MRKPYPSDISREAFKEIEPLLLSGRKQTRPRVVDVYEVFCALLYILKSGCQWNIVKLLYYSYRIRKKLEITHRLSRSTILYAYV